MACLKENEKHIKYLIKLGVDVNKVGKVDDQFSFF